MSAFKEIKREGKRQSMKTAVLVFALLVIIFAMIAGLAYVASRMLTGKPLLDSQIAAVPDTEIVTQPSTDAPDGIVTEPQTQAWNVPEIQTRALYTEYTSTDARMLSLPENGLVNYEYFRTALFIGDSLAQGFGIYPPLNEIATVAGFKGIGPKEIVANYEAKLQTGETVATWDYISAQTPHSIYIAVGTNSLVSMPDDAAFMKYYGDMLDALKAQFPGVDIYVQSITPVRAPETRESMSNDRINGLNNQIAQIATAKGMYYLDLHEVLADANGELREDIASSKDGFHMRDAEGYRIWTDYLARHVISSEYNAQFLAEPFNA
ncbi:MAG: hypothetical protein EOM30_07220 [Clostridia bacterium]|nr:hypothetical protein [Clostridia bacterium]NLS84910.1 hypothetical protein [Oscillospiraceae bacterium]